MISVCDDCEYSTLVADLILKLNEYDKFKLNIWVNNTELPFVFNQTWDFHFLQEGIRVSKHDVVIYILYDLISLIDVRRIK